MRAARYTPPEGVSTTIAAVLLHYHCRPCLRAVVRPMPARPVPRSRAAHTRLPTAVAYSAAVACDRRRMDRCRVIDCVALGADGRLISYNADGDMVLASDRTSCR